MPVPRCDHCLQAVKHSTVSEYIQRVIAQPGKHGIKLKEDICEYAYLPVVASGGAFELRVGAITDESRLHDGVVLLHIGGKYNSECSNICRTFFFHPTPQCVPLCCCCRPSSQPCASNFSPHYQIVPNTQYSTRAPLLGTQHIEVDLLGAPTSCRWMHGLLLEEDVLGLWNNHSSCDAAARSLP